MRLRRIDSRRLKNLSSVRTNLCAAFLLLSCALCALYLSRPASARASLAPQTTTNSITPTAIKIAIFTATSTSGGNVIRWQTSYEVGSLGYNIYRQQAGKRTLVNPTIIAGSAFTTRAGAPLMAGRPYVWTDKEGARDSQYYLEAIGLDGSREMHGPISPQANETGAQTPQSQSTLLNELGAEQASGDESQRGWAASIGGAPETQGGVTNVDTLAAQQQIAAGQAIKLILRKTGWYSISQQQLAAAGLSASVDPRNLQLFVDGAELPMRVNSGQTQFSPGDSIEFYGTGLDKTETDKRVYWLVAGTQAGRRISLDTTSAGSNVNAAPNFAYTFELKDRVLYFPSLINGETDNYFGLLFRDSQPLTQTLDIRNPDKTAGMQATLEVALQSINASPHQVQVIFNGAALGTISFGGITHVVQKFQIASTAIIDGANTLQLNALGTNDVNLIDYARLTYAHTYRADNDLLNFSATGGQAVRVDGFGNSQIRVFDITDQNALQELTPTIETQDASFAARFQVAGAGTRTLLAFAAGSSLSPFSLIKNQPSSWNQFSPGADFVIISYKNFIPNVEPLRALRQSQGWNVAVVDVEDVFDEFSYGTHTPYAIRDFLQWTTTHWTNAPHYVLLVGDADADPKDYLGQGDFDFVPTKMVDVTYIEAGSDDWFADFNGDDIADMAVGRLPVRTSAEADAIISKITNYKSTSPQHSALLVTDSNIGYDFKTATDDLRAILSPLLSTQTISRDDSASATEINSRIIQAINQGPVLVNFRGHGTVNAWTSGSILKVADAPTLTNGQRLPVFVMMTCLNGYFEDPFIESLAEALLKAPNGGGVAVWASSGLTVPDQQALMDQKLYPPLLDGRTLGESVQQAKTGTLDHDIRKTWILFGDPTMRLTPVTTPNSLDTAEFFVRQHYRDFLNREPDAGGLSYWTDQIAQCGADEECLRSRRIGVSAAFFIETEFQQTGYYVYRTYLASLGRRPNFKEFTSDRALINPSQLEQSKQSFADAWVQRTAFLQMYSPTLSPDSFVNKLYDTANLKPYADERQAQITAMQAGKTRAQVLRDVVEIKEFYDREYNGAFVAMQYFGYLRRDPEDGGYLFWVDVLNNKVPGNYRAMACAFITSAEYQLRFGSIVTHSNRECG